MAHPEYTPQLATLVQAPPSGDGWLHEIKYDGYRIGCRIRGDRITLTSRTGKDWTEAFPEIVDAARALAAGDLLLDGEIAIILGDGRTSFQALQNAFAGDGTRDGLAYFVFDLLRQDGERLDLLPLDERKARLQRLLAKTPKRAARIRYADHVVGGGDAFFAQACRLGLEGIISKQRRGPYRPGRHGEWVKTKCVLRQEFVIGGFTDPEGSRAGIGALVVGYFEKGRLIFSGKVGTGFTHKSAVDLRRTLDAIEQRDCPFDPPPEGPLGRRAHWVQPRLVCEIVFTEWTGDGRIRHPSFQGLRADKRAADVVRERAAPDPDTAARVVRRRTGTRRQIEAGGSADGDTAAGDTVAGVRISHPDRVLYEQPRLTKVDVARYYEEVADWIVPHVQGRPLTLVRCPEGLSGGCFFMKHSKVWAPEPLRRVRIQEKKKTGEYLIADDLPGIVGLVQMGVLELHTWNSTFEDLERPDRMVIDLDPGERVGWPQVVRAARTVRAALAALDLEAWVKTTGGRGLHVVVPLVPHADWSQCLEFSRGLSEALERADPDAYTTKFAKAGRADKILIDYLRNNRTNTSIAAYSTRARAGAPVSVPIGWDDLRPALKPESFTAPTIPPRLRRRHTDPWRGYWTSRQKLTAQRVRAVATVEP